jgi:hypothetical protein
MLENLSRNAAQWVGDFIYFLALIAAVWYAWETRKMRLQAIRPKVIFHTPPHVPEHMDDDVRLDFVLRNVGDAPALNVTVERLRDQNFKLRFEPEHLPILPKGEHVGLTMHPAEGAYQPDMNRILDDPSISIRMTARYSDVEGNEFCTSTVIGGGAKPPFIKDV